MRQLNIYKKKEQKNSWLEKERIRAIEFIEESLKMKGLKAADLGEYSNYKEQFDSLDKKSKIWIF